MDRREFEQRVLPHLDAGYNLARWLLRDAAQADDAVQEAALRALRYADALRDGDARPWFLGIVRHACFDALARARRDGPTLDVDDDAFAQAMLEPSAQAGLPAASPSPEGHLQQAQQRARVDAAIRALSPPLREVLVLREFEDLDYAGIARIIGVPVGTVMSRLSRARERLRAVLAPDLEGR